jgi:replicative DNA helicase
MKTLQEQKSHYEEMVDRIAALIVENAELREAATFALRRIAEYNAGGTTETKEMMKRAQEKLYNALREAK